MEGKTHYERIIGRTKAEKELVAQKLQAEFEEESERLKENEVEKSPEDIKILQKSQAVVDQMVTKWGGNPKPLPQDHIYILKPGSVLNITKGKFAGGIHEPLGLKIGVEKKKSKLGFAGTVAHELFHLKSFKSARAGKSGEDVRLYRSGLSMIDMKDPEEEAGEEKEYFGVLEEAIVAECTIKFIAEISKDEEFREEAEAIKKFKYWVIGYYSRIGVSKEKIDEFEYELLYITESQATVKQIIAYSTIESERQAYAAGMFRALWEKGKAQSAERYLQRTRMYALLHKILAESGGKFKNQDEVFEEFARANFSGNYLPLARTIESIFGKGSFRKLAEEFSLEPVNKNP